MNFKGFKEWGGYVVAFLALFLILFFFVNSVTSNFSEDESVERVVVPNVVGKTLTESVEILNDLGFWISNGFLIESKEEFGTVVSIFPPAGSYRSRGSLVELSVSGGSKSFNF